MSDPQTILPPNAAPLEIAIDQALARQLDKLPAPARDHWDADRIPVDALPWLAAYVGVRRWNAEWPEAVRRTLVRNALPNARFTGTVKSVRDKVAAFGGTIAIREWFELTPRGDPGTFAVVLTLSGADGEAASAAYVNDVIAEIEMTKPVSRRFTFTQGLSLFGGFVAQGAAHAMTYRRLDFEGDADPVRLGATADFSLAQNSQLFAVL
jgi:phage tail P2-like protein